MPRFEVASNEHYMRFKWQGIRICITVIQQYTVLGSLKYRIGAFERDEEPTISSPFCSLFYLDSSILWSRLAKLSGQSAHVSETAQRLQDKP